MKKLIRFAFIAFAFFAGNPTLLAQTAPTVAWDKTFGGSLDDRLNSMAITSDGGYILGGWAKSGISGDKSQANRGPSTTNDYWVVKTDAFGNKLWDKTFGGDNVDNLASVQQTSDGGYILGGYSFSGQTGDKSQPNRGTNGSADYWIIKIDALGNKQWDKTFGGNNDDQLTVVKQTTDGGYILGGYSNSPISGDKTYPVSGILDFWIVKVDAAGNKQWDRTYGGSSGDQFYDLAVTSDSGYILGGTSNSPISGDKSQPPIGGIDYWIVKIDAAGNKIWDKTFGGSGTDRLYSIKQLQNGGYIFGGWSDSGMGGDKSQASKGGRDYWVVRTDASGNKVWDKTIGGNADDLMLETIGLPDGTFVLGGSSKSNISGDKSQNNIGSPIENDYWVVKLDGAGNTVWDKTIGSGSSDDFTALSLNSNNDILIGGNSNGGIGGTKTQASQGSFDFWVVKLNPTCADLTATLSPSCGSFGTNVSVNITGIQPAATGTPSWTLTYTVNGISQTATGTTNIFNLATNAATGTVYSLVSIASGTCTNTLTGTFTVQAVPAAPAITAGNSCGPGTVTLSASGAPTGGNYKWYDGATGGTALQTSPTGSFTTPSLSTSTTYYVAVTNNTGCESPRTPVTATITNLSVTSGSTQTICENAAPVQLTGYSPAGGTWSGPGVSATGLFTPGSSLIGSQTLTYTVTQNGCTASATKQVIVSTPPVQPTISLHSPDTLMASTSGSSYEWKHNNTVIPGSNQKLKVTASGTYSVRVLDAANCASAFSADFTYTVSGLKAEQLNVFNLYPNPSTGFFTLELSSAQPSEVTILNALGQRVLYKTVGKTDKKVNLDLASAAKGLYLLQVKTGNEILVRKIVLE